MSAPGNPQLIDFVLHEARLLDELRVDDWLQLFADDGFYWMPLERGQTDARLHSSLMYEDKMLLKISDKEITVVRRALHKILRQREPIPWQALESSTESTYLLHKAARKGFREGCEELNLVYVLPELLADLPEEVAPYFRTA